MQLRRVRIQNFRNFRDLVIEPFPTPAVVVGENGHDAITGRDGSHAATRAAIREAVMRGRKLPVAIVDHGNGPRRRRTAGEFAARAQQSMPHPRRRHLSFSGTWSLTRRC
ncbi:hypothetical protein [Streptomyces zhihengii]|uniref:Uncharacterized protein n=1 Tax=Streptomyces zhihengii TaxID=1818004 RepID=A0ABS2V554_9ACTN|nr:hypothetical protein [Streptomyces zhihengii]MBM9624748.1 hypothetical protein [Streptomyces zhihengii]